MLCDIVHSLWLYCIGNWFLFLLTIQEAMSKDLLEKSTEPDLNIEAYLADAYLHPIFRSFEVDDELVEVRVDNHQTNVADSQPSEPSSPSPPHHVQQPSPPHHIHEPSPPQYSEYQTSPPSYYYQYHPPSPPHYVYQY